MNLPESSRDRGVEGPSTSYGYASAAVHSGSLSGTVAGCGVSGTVTQLCLVPQAVWDGGICWGVP